MKEFLLQLFFPDGVECVVCDQLLFNQHEFLCDECLQKFDFIKGKSCNGCGKSLPKVFDGDYCSECAGREQLFTSGLSCVSYDEFSAAAIWKFKYHHKRYMGRMMGALMSDLLMATYIEDVDVIIPVPIYESKEKTKGYNHSQIIAEEIGRRCHKTVIKDFLVRKRPTKPLKDLTREERIAELVDAFDLNKAYKCLSPLGRKILIVDDIYTTGTTIKECCRILQMFGYKNIIMMTFATGNM